MKLSTQLVGLITACLLGVGALLFLYRRAWVTALQQKAVALESAQTNSLSDSVSELVITSPPKDLFPPPAPLGKLKAFQYIHNEDKCGSKPVYMVILVDTSPENESRRRSVRATYGSLNIPGVPIVTMFLMGKPESSSQQQIIDEESKSFKDILQGNFRDHFRNMSHADLMGIRWVNSYCSQAKYIMKTDDDTFFDLYQLVDVLHNDIGDLQKFMACVLVRTGASAYRDPNMPRWYLSREDHKDDVLEPYCIQSSFIFSPSMGAMIDKTALTVHEGIPVNDVYITGVLMQALQVKHRTFESYFSMDTEYWQKWLDSKPTLPSKYVFAPFPPGNTELAWKLTLKMRQLAAEFGLPQHRHVKNR